jgi:tRNA1(Val) A37 N6-methylase TrmN6
MNLNIFNTANLFEAATNLFQQLGIKLNSNTAEPLPVKDLLKQHYKDNDTFKAIGKTYFIGIIDNTVFQATGMFDVNYSYKEALQQGDKNYDGLMLFALEISKQPTRTEISDLTRTFNRISQKMPVALVLKYKTGNVACFSIAISERFKYKQNWRQGEKAGKVIILRDIHTETAHAGHERILLDLVKPVGVTSYDQLHQHWLQVLDVNILNKKFFQDLANWYFWAMDNVSFPDDLEKKKDVRIATNLIRLITRVVFIWFIKEKSLVPSALFNTAHLDKILKDFNKNKKSQNYYHAILQNLFFGTLNQKMDERKFAKKGDIKTNKEEYGVKNLFRYADLFTISEKEAMQLFKDVPFLNGGLFDCLDKPDEEGKIAYVDGFSRNPKKQATVPDYIFFGEEREVDLNDIYATKNKKYKSRGLINLLESYKFTVAENTPIEEEIALDPELLGNVFENLLASYNPETQTTARKQTGSFYTPREIVNYMVDESLLEFIKQNVKIPDVDFETRLRELISYAETPNPFNEQETKALIESINNCKILDPACGSGAYPMGILHKMVHLLQKLDPENKHWKALQRQKAMEETEDAFKIGDKEERGKRLAEINDVFENNASDYGRKLYLIENCIYGIDIQPIAVQISKLRFFISLIIDQNKQASKENFGIRSLPNLETKFVAANTLIGLNKPQQTLLRNPDIEVKEHQLKELRHKYFTANTRKEKLQYQKLDKKLRQEIAKMLESDGWQTAVAKQIVAFDPYDQNTFASWFDPEWMFGHSNGFDIVIGNPPYHQLSKDESASDEYKLYLKTRFGTSGGRLNTFIFFTHIGVELLKQKGVITYIIPNTILTQDYYKETRKYLLDKTILTQIVSYNELPFENAVVENITFFALKSIQPDYTIKHFNDNLSIIEFDTEKTKKEFYKSDTFSFNFRSNEITEKICQNTILLGDLCNINQAIALKGDKSL